MATDVANDYPDDQDYDEEPEPQPQGPFVSVTIEYKGKTSSATVELFGSWDWFKGGVFLDYIGDRTYSVELELPVGNHYYRFWVTAGGEEEYETNDNDPKTVKQGYEYNTIEVSEHQDEDEAEPTEDEGGEDETEGAEDTHLIFDGGNLVVGASTKKQGRKKRRGRPSMEVVLDTTFVEEAQAQDQMDALEEAKEASGDKKKRKKRSKKKKKKNKPSGFENLSRGGADLAQVFKQKEEEWARMCFVQQLRQQQHHNDEINRVKTLWKQERAVRVDMHKKVMQQKNEMEKKLIALQSDNERLKSNARIGDSADRRRVEQVTREKEALSTEMQSLRQENRQLQERVQQARRDKVEVEKATRAQNSDLDGQYKRSQSELAQLRADAATLRAQNESLQRNLSTIRETNDQLLASKQEQFQQQKQRWDEEKQELLKERDRAQEFRQRATALEEELRAAGGQKDLSDSRYEQAQSKIAQLEERLNAAKQQVSDLENSTAAQDQIRVEVERTRSALETEKQTLSDKIEALERRLNEQRESYEEQIGEIRKKHTTDMSSLTEQTDAAMSQQLSELQNQISEKESSIREAENRIQTLESTCSERDGSIANLQAQLDQAREEASSSGNRETELKQQKKAAEDEVANLRNQLEDQAGNAQNAERESNARITQLEADLSSLREQSGAQTQELQESNTRLSEQLATLKEQLDSTAATAADSGQKLIESQRALEEAKGEGAALQSRLDSLQATLEEERTQSQSRVGELTEEINRINEQMATELGEKDTQLQALQDDASKLRAEISERDNRFNEAETRLQQMQSELELSKNQWDREREALERQVASAQQKDEAIITACKNMFQKFQVLRNDLDEIRNNKIMELERMNEFFPNFSSLLDKAFGFNQQMVENLMEKYKKELSLRRKYFNIVQDLRGNIRVFCRVRPLLSRELDRGDTSCLEFPQENAIVVQDEQERKHEFEFDRVYIPGTTQQAVTEDTTEYIQSVMDGYNVSIFAYGQTGSGKTYTMDGPADDPGVNASALKHLFKIAQERVPMFEYTIKVAIFEIYNEKIRDLLVDRRTAQGTDYKVRLGPDGTVEVNNLLWEQVTNEDDVSRLTAVAKEHRSATATNMNEHSSRSHMLLVVDVRGINVVANIEYLGRLYLVDLAGSERVKNSKAEGDALREAQNINKSLSALGDVMQALQQKGNFIPYRNSTLTKVMQNALGGNAKTVMFINCCPTAQFAFETTSSLQFASRVAKVELGQATATKKPQRGGAGDGGAPRSGGRGRGRGRGRGKAKRGR